MKLTVYRLWNTRLNVAIIVPVLCATREGRIILFESYTVTMLSLNLWVFTVAKLSSLLMDIRNFADM
jgi:hypothetical protein